MPFQTKRKIAGQRRSLKIKLAKQKLSLSVLSQIQGLYYYLLPIENKCSSTPRTCLHKLNRKWQTLEWVVYKKIEILKYTFNKCNMPPKNKRQLAAIKCWQKRAVKNEVKTNKSRFVSGWPRTAPTQG